MQETAPSSMTPITIDAFDRAAIPLEQWNHRAHLTIAYLILRELPLEQATDRMRHGVQRYNAAHGIALTPTSGYHDTLTIAWMKILHASMAVYGPASSADEFFSQHPHLL